MHVLEPFYRWEKYYVANEDDRCPFYGREYDIMCYSRDIYGYYIHPYWDDIGSETLYLKLIYANYDQNAAIIELLGEWNDTLHNDVEFLKRNLIDPLVQAGIDKFILIGENVMNFHGSDDCYYEEWFEDVEDGWIVGINFREFVVAEMQQFNIDSYVNFGGNLDQENWRTLKPEVLVERVNGIISRRIGIG